MRYVADIGKSDGGTRLYLCPSRKVAVLQVVEPDVYLGDPFGDRTPPPATGGHHRIGCRTNRALDRSISASRRKPDHSLLLERAQKCPSVERSITRSREILDRTRVGLPRDKVRTRLSPGGGSLERTRLWTRIPCLSGKLQGILSIRAATSQIDIQNNASYQQLRVKFPTRTNRELSNRSRELNRRIRECSNVRMFWPDEVAPPSRRAFSRNWSYFAVRRGGLCVAERARRAGLLPRAI
jgi:hypothetical protein